MHKLQRTNLGSPMSKSAVSRRLGLVRAIMQRVYGEWSSDVAQREKSFPLPLPEVTAGPSQYSSQRRYLWTDSFGLANFVTMAYRARQAGNAQDESDCVWAATRLVEAVHQTLGRPRAESFPMRVSKRGSTKFVGLRIGKTRARHETDGGMTYDGQYWHYIDKWMFAVSRLAVLANNTQLMREALAMMKETLSCFLQVDSKGQAVGVHWKLNSDMRPIAEMGNAGTSNDALTAYVVLHVMQTAASHLGIDDVSVEKEMAALRLVARRFWISAELAPNTASGSDPLGFGLRIWELQWFGAFADSARNRLCQSAPICLSQQQLSMLPFRCYGGVMGALVAGNEGARALAEQLVDKVVEMGWYASERGDLPEQEPSLVEINEVMFATCLDPWAFRRQAYEQSVLELL